MMDVSRSSSVDRMPVSGTEPMKAYASTDESGPRQAIRAQLNAVLAKLDQQGTGTASNAAVTASLRGVAGDLVRALQSYDPHSASATRSFKAAADALGQAVDAHGRGDLAGLGQLQATLARVLPGQESVSHANAGNQATMASLLQNAGFVGRDARAESRGPNADPAAAARVDTSALTPLLQQLSGQAASARGLSRMSLEALTGLAGDVMSLATKPGAAGSPAGQKAFQAVIQDLRAAAGGDMQGALGHLGQDITALGAVMGQAGGTMLAPIQADLAGLQHLSSVAASAPATSGSRGSSGVGLGTDGLPATAGQNEAQKFDTYHAMLGGEGEADLAAGKKVVLAVRKDTALASNDRHGEYDDRVVVLWQDGAGKHATELRANTEPSGQYGVGGERASHGRSDLGRLKEGTYKFDPNGQFLGDASFRSERTQTVERYQPKGGTYDESAAKVTDTSGAGTSLLIHRGGENNTWSAGCQTMPPEEFDKFKALVGGQGSFTYVLKNAKDLPASAAPGGTAVASEGSGGLSAKGLEFIYQHEHEDGKLIDHPSAGSGVTFGAGYDIRYKSAAQVVQDLMGAGLDAGTAQQLAKGVGLSGRAADAFVAANRHLLDGQGKAFELAMIKPELQEVGRTIDQTVRSPLSQGQRDALTSFIFTAGSRQFKDSDTLAALQRGDVGGAMRALSHEYIKSEGVVMPGLVQRRKDEAALFAA